MWVSVAVMDSFFSLFLDILAEPIAILLRDGIKSDPDQGLSRGFFSLPNLAGDSMDRKRITKEEKPELTLLGKLSMSLTSCTESASAQVKRCAVEELTAILQRILNANENMIFL